MITVLTAAYGGDVLQEQPEQSVECRWLAVTDYMDWDTTQSFEGWDVVCEPRPHVSPRVASRVPKYLPGKYVGFGEIALWLDCSVRLTSPHAIDRLTSLTAEFGGISMIPHPDRRTVRDEVPEAMGQGRYEHQMLREQYEWYVENPMAWIDDRLWATTVIAQVVTPRHHNMGLGWLLQNVIWTAQDQISLPWVAANIPVHIQPITLDLWDNEYFTLRQRERDV